MSPKVNSGDPPSGPESRRILFLDDDPARAETFLAANPDAVWVQTADDCIARLAEPWHEVHLDHDLGGEHFVDLTRDDCGMAVVRWLCLAPHPHLEGTNFLIHSHNPGAARIMLMQMQVAGFQVEHRPFGMLKTLPSPDDQFWNHRPVWHDWLIQAAALLRRVFGRKPVSRSVRGGPEPPTGRVYP